MFVEIFRTSVSSQEEAGITIACLQQLMPGCNASIDLEDCDKVLRIATEQEIDVQQIIYTITQKGHHIAVLEW